MIDSYYHIHHSFSQYVRVLCSFLDFLGARIARSRSVPTSKHRHGMDESFGPRPMVVAVPSLVARRKIETTSAKIGEIAAGTRCTVHDVLSHRDLKRARILVTSGPLADTECWITMAGKDGAPNLAEPPSEAAQQEALAAARAAFDEIDVDGDGNLSPAELKKALMRPGGGQSLSDEEADEIIAMFDQNGDGEIQFVSASGCLSDRLSWLPALIARPAAYDG